MTKLLIFDLDETLIHVKRDKPKSNADQDEESIASFEPEVDIPVDDPYLGIRINASFSVRPYTRKLLQFANKHFEVAIFTAGNRWFANPILDYLDPDGTLFQHRFFREHTSILEDSEEGYVYVKDLSILTGGNTLTLDDILIVDNNIYSFAFNLENGVAVRDYLGDKSDKCLL
jgi:Dullard-like phosphatase family protein